MVIRQKDGKGDIYYYPIKFVEDELCKELKKELADGRPKQVRIIPSAQYKRILKENDINENDILLTEDVELEEIFDCGRCHYHMSVLFCIAIIFGILLFIFKMWG